jgi:hypothetical protein
MSEHSGLAEGEQEGVGSDGALLQHLREAR